MTTLRHVNEYLATIPQDTMNDYVPPAIWLDTDSGTYGDAKRLVIIDVSRWNDDDEQVWHDMTDSERSGYGIDYAEWSHSYGTTPDLAQALTPSEYMREIGR
jgi:hypothetical protein